MDIEKKCSKCGEIKKLEEFAKSTINKSGRRAECKKCYSKYVQDYAKRHPEKNKRYREKQLENNPDLYKEQYDKNKERYLKSSKAYAKRNREKINATTRERYNKKKEHILQNQKEWKAKNKEKVKQSKRRYYEKNKEKILQKDKERNFKNKDQIAQKKKEYRQKNKDVLNQKRQERLKRDPHFKLRKNLSQRIRVALEKGYKKSSTVELLGCSVAEFKTYFENLFTPGMSWALFLKGEIHIDHKISCSSFDLTDPEQQKIAFNYKNLQPLWSTTRVYFTGDTGSSFVEYLGNINKGAKIIKETVREIHVA